MIDIDETGVFLGLDVGKSNPHGRGLTPAGQLLTGRTTEFGARPDGFVGPLEDRK